MVKASLIRRIQVAESRSGLVDVATPALFVVVEDCSVRDPDTDAPTEPIDYQGDVVGLYTSNGHTLKGTAIEEARRVSRRDGESIEALETRARRLVPGATLFFHAYRSLSWSVEKFDAIPEAAETDAACRATAAPRLRLGLKTNGGSAA